MGTESAEKDIVENLKSLSLFGYIYQFFDTYIHIRTNLKETLQGFDKIYWRFRRPQELDTKNPVQDLYIVQTDKHSSKLAIIFQDTHQFFEQTEITPNLFLFVFSFILPKVKSHFLIHAATLSHKGKGTIITAHSTSGKTTLAVELIKRGIQFLSDELAPIHRVSGFIDPFPRSIGLRNLKVHDLQHLASDKIHRSPNAKGEIKWMIDPEELHSNAVAGACLCQNVIFLEPQYEEKADLDSHPILEVSLVRISQSLLLAIKRIPGVIDVEIIQDRIFPLLRIKTENESHILQEIEESTKAYQSAIVSVVNGRTKKPDFSRKPLIKPIPKFEGTFELAKMILNAHCEASLMDDFKGSPARMLNDLADITGSFHFYKLMVGRLDLMTDIVEELIING